MILNRSTEHGTTHYEYIDSLRGLAILGVIVTHIGGMLPIPDWLEMFTGRGAQGLQLFFLVSSLTLFLSYSQRVSVDGVDTDKLFYIRRFFRIAPAFYVASLFYLILSLLNNYLLTGNVGNVNVFYILVIASFLGLLYPSALTILPHFGSSTVMIEMFYYAFVPFLYRKIGSLKRAIYFFAISLVFFELLEIFLHSMNATEFVSEQVMYFPEQLPVFVLGIICYFLITHVHFENKNANVILFFSIGYLIFFAFCAKSSFCAELFGIFPISIVYSIGLAGLVLAMSMKKFTFFQNPFTEFMGKISYSLYLWHFAALSVIPYFLKKFNLYYSLDPVTMFVLSVIGFLIFVIPFSFVSYQIIEKNGIDLGKRAIRKIQTSNNN